VLLFRAAVYSVHFDLGWAGWNQIETDDGQGFVDQQECDPVQGLACSVRSGLCDGPCASLGSASYIGCDYYPVVTAQLDNFIDDKPYAGDQFKGDKAKWEQSLAARADNQNDYRRAMAEKK